MPPRRRSTSPKANPHISAFERAHPTMQKLLLTGFQISSPLLIATTLFAAGVMRRPLWERAFFWRAALASFLCRWVWLGCMITWTLTGWGGPSGDDAGSEQGQDLREED